MKRVCATSKESLIPTGEVCQAHMRKASLSATHVSQSLFGVNPASCGAYDPISRRRSLENFPIVSDGFRRWGNFLRIGMACNLVTSSRGHCATLRVPGEGEGGNNKNKLRTYSAGTTSRGSSPDSLPKLPTNKTLNP